MEMSEKSQAPSGRAWVQQAEAEDRDETLSTFPAFTLPSIPWEPPWMGA